MNTDPSPDNPSAGIWHTEDASNTIRFAVVDGPTIPSTAHTPADAPLSIGRKSTCDWRLDDPTVSRLHAELGYDRGDWTITDHGSRAGTFLNEHRLASTSLLDHGDILDIGPWRFRVIVGTPSNNTLTIQDDAATDRTFKTSSTIINQPIEAKRLELLLDYAGELHEAADEQDLASRLLRAAGLGANFEHGVVVLGAHSASEALIMASHGEPRGVSRTVLHQASQGRVVRMQGSPELQEAQSLIMDGVEDVLCIPIQSGERPYAYLYLTRKESVYDEAPEAFCLGLVKLAEITLSGLRRRGLEREIQAAHDAQKRILPPAEGTAPGFDYAMMSRPGRGVAGDLFDVVPINSHRTAILLGDITGKGAGAGLLMSAAQAFLNGVLTAQTPLDAAVRALDAYIVSRSMPGEFLTLWIGIYDAQTRELVFTDAGHGFCAVSRGGQEPVLLECEGGPPLGIDADFPRPLATTSLAPGDHLVLFSDGLVEQQDPGGDEFGLGAILGLLGEPRSPAARVTTLAEAVVAHAGSDQLKDDLTIACAAFTP